METNSALEHNEKGDSTIFVRVTEKGGEFYTGSCNVNNNPVVGFRDCYHKTLIDKACTKQSTTMFTSESFFLGQMTHKKTVLEGKCLLKSFLGLTE